MLRTASLNSEFTGSYTKSEITLYSLKIGTIQLIKPKSADNRIY